MKIYTVKLINGDEIDVKANGHDVFHDNLVCFYTTSRDINSKVYEWSFSLFNVLYIRERKS